MTGPDDAAASPLSPDRPRPQEVDGVLERLERLGEDRDRVAFGEIVSSLGARGFAPLLLALAVLMVLPTGMIPGMGGALGGLMAVIGLQVMRGARGVWLPEFLAQRQIGSRTLRAGVHAVRPVSAWLSGRLSGSLSPLATGKASLTVIAFLLIVAGAAMTVLGAVPILAPLVGLPILLFSVGILSGDGRAVLAGHALLVLPVAAVVMWTVAG